MKYLYLLLIAGVLQGMKSDCEKYRLLEDGSHSSSNSSLVDPTFIAVLEKDDIVRESEDEELLKLVRQFKELIIQQVPEYESNEVALSFVLKQLIDSAVTLIKEKGADVDLRKVQYDYGYYVRLYLRGLITPSPSDGYSAPMFPQAPKD
jgi:hypothetical protein